MCFLFPLFVYLPISCLPPPASKANGGVTNYCVQDPKFGAILLLTPLACHKRRTRKMSQGMDPVYCQF